jgi:signal transduction histidine kinase
MTAPDRAARPGPLRRVTGWWAGSWRPIRTVLAGGPVAFLSGAVLFTVVLLWFTATLSLVTDPENDWVNRVIYLLAALLGPLVLAWCGWGLGRLQRLRLNSSGTMRLLTPPRPRGRNPLRIWRSAATSRQLAYHGLALVTGTGSALVLATALSAWLVWPAVLLNGGGQIGAAIVLAVLGLALLAVAPLIAGQLARADQFLGRTLLGPSRTEALALRVESLSRSRDEILAATDAERRRIERDLHDGAQQRLVYLAMNLGMARELTDLPEAARKVIEQAHDEATLALTELREFIRGLHPAVLNDRGLDAALSGVVAGAPIPVRLRVDVAPRCSPTIEAIAYFSVTEALTNVVRHAGASRADVTVTRIGRRLRVEVRDDGRGGAAMTGTGLRGLAQRAGAVDGTLTVHSPLGGPTLITVELPCES